MATLRSVNTEFWADEYVEDLSRDGKFLFLYLITNPLTNIAGAYKISRKRIKQDTDFTDAELDDLLGRFERDGKVVYRDGWMFLPNFLKNQSLGGNLPKTAINLALETPDWVQAEIARMIRESPKLTSTFASAQDLVLCLKTKSYGIDDLSHKDVVLCHKTKSGSIDTRSAKGREGKGKEDEGEEDTPTGFASVAGELAVQQIETAFKIKLDLDTQQRVVASVPPTLAHLWPAFVQGRSVGLTRLTDREKLAKIGYVLTDFQRDHKKELAEAAKRDGPKPKVRSQEEKLRDYQNQQLTR